MFSKTRAHNNGKHTETEIKSKKIDVLLKNEIKKLIKNESELREDPVIDQYFQIVEQYGGLLNNLHIAQAILDYQDTGRSIIDFLNFYSDEQKKFITHPIRTNSKLIACAGSGKTRSIIGKIKFMVEHNLVDSDKIFMITFTRHAVEDFRNKVESIFPYHESFCKVKNFMTVDALAKSILIRVKSHKSDNFEILSIALRNYLLTMSEEQIESFRKANPISHLFVDEAQDLNAVQNDIIWLLQKILGTTVELIGDPNQNIYQFRNSSSDYLMNFEGVKFELTLNWRSTKEIINFSEYLKPVSTTKSSSGKNTTGNLVSIIQKPKKDIISKLLGFLKMYEKTGDLTDVAIICPTRGTATRTDLGLSIYFNLLHENNIPFVQLYEESDFRKGNHNFSKKSGHVNLLTWHGTKGLEFDVVFVMDCFQNIFHIQPKEEEHLNHKYLLYVACSRAMSKMFICIYSNSNGGYANNWLRFIPKNIYDAESPLRFPKLEFRKKDNTLTVPLINGVVDKIKDEDLDYVHTVLKINHTRDKCIYNDYKNLDLKKSIGFYEMFCKELFYFQWTLENLKNKK